MDSMACWIASFCVWLVFAATGAYVSAEKGRAPFEGAALVFLFGPLGLVVAALLPPSEFREWRPGHRAARPELEDEWA